jgi:hypothetical protein
MNLMKWLRKNNKKLMAVVVIVLMIAFIGGSSLSYLLGGNRGARDAIAYYGQKQKITPLDRNAADQEIEILTALGAEGILQAQDLRGLLLSELVFRQNRNAAMVDMARQAIQRNRYRISDEQLSELFTNRSTVPPDMFWILLCDEAQTAGIRITNEEVGQLLERLIPQLFEKRTYGQVVPSIMNRFSVPEERILTTFGKLLAVLQYAQIIASVENVTASQIKHMASGESESLDVEFVPLKASHFANRAETPPEQAVKEQFNRYKASFPGDVNEANPFGFGYRLPDRVQFDYIALKLADVASITKPPTEEEAEQYYQQNRDRQFTEKRPSDPNDPNSPQVAQVQAYAEVADTIMSQLRRQRVTTKAEQILQEARNLADANLPAAGPEGRELTAEQRTKKDGEYVKIATDLGKKHNLPLYSGRTGLLSVLDMQGDKVLRRMFLTAYGYSPIPLTQILFSVKELGDRATILLSMPPAEMYAGIGPARDAMSATASDLADQIMVIARVVQVEKSAPPADVDVTFSTKTLGLGEASGPKKEVFSVKEQVANDVKALAAWDTTKNRAEEFMALAAKDGWDRAVTQFNQLYGKQAKADPNDPNVFTVDRQAGMQRISDADLQVLIAQVGNSPAAPIVLNQARTGGQFIDRLYSLVPAKSNTPPQLPLIVEFKPNQCYYVVKSLSVQRLTQEDFQKMKGMLVRREEYSQVENLAAVHFSPENILKRMNFKFAHPTDESGEGETKQKSKEAS